MVTLVTFSLRRNLQFEEGQVSNLLTEEIPAVKGWVTLVTLSLRRNLQLEEGQVRNLLTEGTPAGWGWLPW
jgi:hypothetical protein